jgi:hypothetical protein
VTLLMKSSFPMPNPKSKESLSGNSIYNEQLR